MRLCLIYVKVGEYVHPRNSTVQDLLGCGPVGCWCLNGRRKWMMFCILASTGRKTYPFVYSWGEVSSPNPESESTWIPTFISFNVSNLSI